MDSIGTGYTSHDKEMYLMNDETYEVGGGLKKWWFFPPKTSYKQGTDVKQGKQVGFLGQKM